jgi:hypothetical protein
MSSPEHLLPAELLARAIRSGEEYGWSFEDLPVVLRQARARALAVIGGQVQFKFPDGTCELYWYNADASPRWPGEPWNSYVERTHLEVQAGLDRLPSSEALVAEGVESFPFLEAKAREGVDLTRFLCFICYFDAAIG